MAFAESWHVRSRSRECAATHRAFTEGEPLVTALYPDPESSGYLRRDLCLEAWNARAADAEQPFSFWQTTFSVPVGSEARDPAAKLSAEALLQRLVVEDEDHTENTRYLLAVMLERQKLLRETDHQRTPHGILRVYEHRKTGEIYLIRDPDIPLAQVEAFQNEVITLLENNGRRPEPMPAQPPEESPESPAAEESAAPAAAPAAAPDEEPAEEPAEESAEESDEEPAAAPDEEPAEESATGLSGPGQADPQSS